MSQNAPYVITISRQIGSGGAYIGQRLAAKLVISYVDREIVHQTAERLNMSEDDLVSRDERVTPLWRSFLESSVYSNPQIYVPPPLDITTDESLYRAESGVILDIVKQTSAVIIGRGGYYVLRRHPRHLSILLHADTAFRQQRIQELYHLSPQKAGKMLLSVDKARASYLRILTHVDWADARQYHMSLDTGVLGLESVEDMIVAAVHARFAR
jgi:CMP/dCMP kinase